jgi:hypothetical protein
MWRYATIDSYGIWAHTEKPYLNDDGYYTSEGSTMFMSPSECVLFERDNPEPLEHHLPNALLPEGHD